MGGRLPEGEGRESQLSGIGSSGGIKQIIGKTADSAESDAPLKDDELAKDGLFQFSTVVDGVLPVVSLPGIKPGELTLSGEVLGYMYPGKIRKWNGPAISALNRNIKLPDTNVDIVWRADGSGMSFIWTHYLSQVNPEWNSNVGEDTTVGWPTGTGDKGNDGVAAFVQRIPGIPGALGYVGWAYVKQNHMVYTAMQNASGAVVQHDTETFKAAVASADWSKSFYQILTNEQGKQAWPVVGATFVLLHTVQDKPEIGKKTLRFFDWAFAHGMPDCPGSRLHQSAAISLLRNPLAVERKSEGHDQ